MTYTEADLSPHGACKYPGNPGYKVPNGVRPSTSNVDSKVVSSGVTFFIEYLDLHFCDQINVKEVPQSVQ